ncbi:ABC transporter substrate-binding protein [Streptomyces sp. DK15]|uniref:ABC transporter substrate-binding protein n=1 Tax=Streptomyces sp. DK15 TaxID=2957499 RepID=UPI0029BD659D|nr:ABC transporter substrate-binding protein [Streptomyces sp. DK15]MDX2395193.1 ABC transporter substrate-binding protein [Streptomyces sp. DK15]
MTGSIKIAIAGPQTGSTAEHGADLEIGVRQAVRDINASGGVNGKRLEAWDYDDAGEPKQAVAVANKIVNEGRWKFVVGHMASATAALAADIYDGEGIIMITPGATGPEPTDRGYKLIFRTIGLDSTQGPADGNSFDKDPENKEIVEALKTHGIDPSRPYIFRAYAAVQVIAEGIKAAGSEDTERVADAIHNGKFKTVIGTLSFDGKGDLRV